MNHLVSFYRPENIAALTSPGNDLVPFHRPRDMATSQQAQAKDGRCDSGVYTLDNIPPFDLVEWSTETIGEIRAVLEEAERPNGFDDLEIARRVYKLRVERAAEAEKARAWRDKEGKESRQLAVQQGLFGGCEDVAATTQHHELSAGKDADDDDDRTIRASSVKKAAREMLVGRVMTCLNRRNGSM